MIPPLWTPAPIGSARPMVAVRQGSDAGAPTFATLLAPPADTTRVLPEPEPMAEASDRLADPRSLQHVEPRWVAPHDLPPFVQVVPAKPAALEPLPAMASVMTNESRRYSFPNDVPTGKNANGTQAQVFNHDGFFGTAIVVESAPVASFAARSAEPEQPAAALAHAPVTADIPYSPVRPATMAAKPSSNTPSATATSLRVGASHTRPVAPAPPSVIARPIRPAVRPGTVCAVPVRRPVLPTPAAFVAIAVQAVANGLDIVARIDRHDPATAHLADEIAALLSRHGYAPARIAVLGPASAPKER